MNLNVHHLLFVGALIAVVTCGFYLGTTLRESKITSWITVDEQTAAVIQARQ